MNATTSLINRVDSQLDLPANVVAKLGEFKAAMTMLPCARVRITSTCPDLDQRLNKNTAGALEQLRNTDLPADKVAEVEGAVAKLKNSDANKSQADLDSAAEVLNRILIEYKFSTTPSKNMGKPGYDYPVRHGCTELQSADEDRRRQDEPGHLGHYQDGPMLSAPFLRKLEKSLDTMGDIHVLGRTVGNETRSYVGALAMLMGMLKSNSVFAVAGSTDLIQKIDTFNIVSKKVVDCTVGVNLCEGKSMIGQDFIDKAIDALRKATKVNTSPSVTYQETINELDKPLSGLEDILRGAEDQDGIGEACTRLTAANVQYKKLPDRTSLVWGPASLLVDMCTDTRKCIVTLPH
ncbi:hypothetical protein BGZ81_004219 [Podila clonocystis]|nr:hypothetical protein BGZ81_004219 [Podila clonocystis]